MNNDGDNNAFIIQELYKVLKDVIPVKIKEWNMIIKETDQIIIKGYQLLDRISLLLSINKDNRKNILLTLSTFDDIEYKLLEKHKKQLKLVKKIILLNMDLLGDIVESLTQQYEEINDLYHNIPFKINNKLSQLTANNYNLPSIATILDWSQYIYQIYATELERIKLSLINILKKLNFQEKKQEKKQEKQQEKQQEKSLLINNTLIDSKKISYILHYLNLKV